MDLQRVFDILRDRPLDAVAPFVVVVSVLAFGAWMISLQVRATKRRAKRVVRATAVATQAAERLGLRPCASAGGWLVRATWEGMVEGARVCLEVTECRPGGAVVNVRAHGRDLRDAGLSVFAPVPHHASRFDGGGAFNATCAVAVHTPSPAALAQLTPAACAALGALFAHARDAGLTAPIVYAGAGMPVPAHAGSPTASTQLDGDTSDAPQLELAARAVALLAR